MTSDTPKNIFEAIGKAERTHRKASSKEAKEFPIEAMLERCHKLHEDIASSLDRMFSAEGLSRRQYETYVSDQKHFSKEEWALIEKTKQQTESQLQELVSETKVGKKEPPQEKIQKLAPGSPEAKRRPPSRRQWLQMH